MSLLDQLRRGLQPATPARVASTPPLPEARSQAGHGQRRQVLGGLAED